MTNAMCIIPARGGSVRIPRKNIREFHGRPIIAYSIKAALDAFGDAMVSTEDHEIAAIAETCGARVLWRPKLLADGKVGTQDVMAHAVGSSRGPAVCLYPCAPMVTANMLKDAVKLLDWPGTQYVVPVGEWLRDPGMFYVGHAYSFRVGAPLLAAGTRLFPIGLLRAIDINTEDDWLRAERMYAELNHQEATA